MLLDLGLKKQRPIVRSVVKLTSSSYPYLVTSKLNQLKQSDFESKAFVLRRKIVDTTPGSNNKEFRKQTDEYIRKMYKDLRAFFVRRDQLLGS